MNPEPCERCRRRSPSTWVDGLWVCYTCRMEMHEEDEMGSMISHQTRVRIDEDSEQVMLDALYSLVDKAFEMRDNNRDRGRELVFEVRVKDKPEIGAN